MYSVEWQKRGLPHAHILIWFVDKIRAEDINSLISVEIPDPSTDQLLFDIVTTNMIHGPCGILNRSSPCMVDGKCTKRFPKDFINDTVTHIDGYPIYRRRSTENGGQSFIKTISNADIDIDNRWVVPYSPLLSKTFNAHINPLTPSGPQNLTTFVYGGFVDIWIREMDSSAFSLFLLTVGGRKRTGA
ncbi:hypothetical protein AVEN_190173-1 [Araneus ventricosus]|uniref:Helitron helicase-like domain-containing protein n=1 Tax=Araneus ventricosus TaxID=182803 RepID=A0A4Y2CP89_ARAVE|nr:hypothetical protein AVEN_190173-1 [Araneus ventricosus]